ncbi:MAG: hypothetical protein V1811_02740 [Candidatus Micrarchaeota archaeon]
MKFVYGLVALMLCASLAFAQVPGLVSPSPANGYSWQYCSTLTFKASSNTNTNFYLTVAGTLVDKWLMTKSYSSGKYYGTLSFTGDLVDDFVDDGNYQWRICNSLNECTNYRTITKTSPPKKHVYINGVNPPTPKIIVGSQMSWDSTPGAQVTIVQYKVNSNYPYNHVLIPGDSSGWQPTSNFLPFIVDQPFYNLLNTPEGQYYGYAWAVGSSCMPYTAFSKLTSAQMTAQVFKTGIEEVVKLGP